MKLFLLLLIHFLYNNPNYYFQQDIWTVPESAKNTVNPTDRSDTENIEAGKEIYMQLCSSCHGIEGRGDGKMSTVLNLQPKNFTNQHFQSQSDGAIFYKITTGRGQMPSFEKKIEEEDRWYLVNYLRTYSE